VKLNLWKWAELSRRIGTEGARSTEKAKKKKVWDKRKIRRKGGNKQINYNHNYIWTPSRLV
jgi:hypothetical protein